MRVVSQSLNLLKSYQNNQNSELKMLIEVYKIIDYMFQLSQSLVSNTISSSNSRLREILEYIHQNYKNQISLEDIASHVHMSRTSCSRFFNQTMNQSLFNYLIWYRINQSKIDLKETNLTIVEIAMRSGFNSQSYYTKKFKEYTGYSPNKYRKIHK